MSRRDKLSSLIKEISAQFLERESNHSSLITVTNCSVSEDTKKATVYITVLPEEKEKAAIGFAKRKRSELRDKIKKSLNVKIIPYIDIEIDMGEKNRQRIDELLRNS